MSSPAVPDYNSLQALLRERLQVIADHDWRTRDPESQLARLQQISTDITDWQSRWQDQIPPRLGHFLSQASFQKALDWIAQKS